MVTRSSLQSNRGRTPLHRCSSLVVVAVVMSISFVVAEPVWAEPAAGCAPVTLLVVPDTWDTRPNANPEAPAGELRAVVEALRKRFEGRTSALWLAYPAVAFTQGKTYFDSRTAGVAAARAAVARAAKECRDTKFVGIGHGQGADVVGEVAVEIGAGKGPIPADRFIAGGTVSDPNPGTPGEVNLSAKAAETKSFSRGRKSGYGVLSGEIATLCRPGEGCAPRQDDQLAEAIGTLLNRLPGAGPTPAQAQLATDLGAVDGNPAQLSSVPIAVRKLLVQAQDGNITAAGRTVATLSRLIDPVGSLIAAVDDPVVVNGLLDTRLGSQSQMAGQVLRAMSQVDFTGLTADFTAAATAATQRDTRGLLSAAQAATDKLASLGGFPDEQIASAGLVLQCMRPVAVLARMTDLGAVTGADYGAVSRAAESAPGLVRDGDIAGLHRALRGIEAWVMPLAEVVEQLDFAPVSQLLALWPVGSPERKVGDALSALRNLDWPGLTRDLRALGTKLGQFDSASQRAADAGRAPTTIDDLFGVDVVGLSARIAEVAKQGLAMASSTVTNPDRSLVAGLTSERLVARGIGEALRFSGLTSNTYDETENGDDKSALSALVTWLGERIESALVKLEFRKPPLVESAVALQ